jgi:signal transduction histidine kinase
MIKKILVLLLVFHHFGADAIEGIFLKDCNNRILIGHKIEFCTDYIGGMSVEQVIAQKAFVPCTQAVPNFNLTSDTKWMHFVIMPNDNAIEYILEISNPLCNQVNLFTKNNQGVFEQISYGDDKKYKERKYDFPAFLFDINNKTNEPKDYYLQVQNHEQFQVPMYIGSKEVVIDQNRYDNYLITIFMTILSVMFIYNFFIFISVKEKSYLLYVLYIVFIGIAQIALKGYGFQLLWPNHIWLQQHGTYIFSGLTGITSLLFFQNFIGKENISVVFQQLIKVVIFGYICCILLSLIQFYTIGYVLLQILALLAVAIVLIAGVHARQKQVASANYFLLAWIVFIVGIVLFVLKDYNVIPYTVLSIYTMPIGCAVEVLLLSFALANRIKQLQKDKEASQRLVLQAAIDAEKVLSGINERLEKQVDDRTQALQDANINLETAMTKLKKSEVELVNKEKMSSLGVLTAGIAHEINNPINFVTSSITPLKRDIKDILYLIEEYSKINTENRTDEQLASVKNLYDKIDTPYLIEEINQLLNGIEEGAFRTAGIVKGLQKFSRSDEHIFRNSDVIDGIENTLTLLNSQIKDTILLSKDYHPIPELHCSIGKLNQVFLNLLSNAIHAVMDNGRKQKTITIQTKVVNKYVEISIKDNGIGMNDAVKSKIFDPFFTTKEVGQGTGLGLAICQGIIHDHAGTIRVDSVVNEGTTFTIKLPIEEHTTDEINSLLQSVK